MDERFIRIRTLIGEIEERESELTALMGGAPAKTRKPQQCSKCGQEGHSARTCSPTQQQ